MVVIKDSELNAVVGIILIVIPVTHTLETAEFAIDVELDLATEKLKKQLMDWFRENID